MVAYTMDLGECYIEVNGKRWSCI